MQSTAARRWAALIDEAEHSDLTHREFAAKVGVNVRTFSWWKWRLRSTRRTTATAPFIEVVESEPTGSLRVEVGERVAVAVDHSTDLDLLRRVVEALC